MDCKILTKCLVAIVSTAVLSGCGSSSSSGPAPTVVTQANLVSDQAGAANRDTNLVNGWGISYGPTGPFWVSSNGAGKSTIYDGTGATVIPAVNIPAAGGGANGPVTGQAFNGTTGFLMPGTATKSVFIFVNEDGIVSAWAGGASATTVADRSSTGAVYKGVAIGQTIGGAPLLLAANFNSGKIDVFDTNFTYVRSTTDPSLPAGYAPFGIQTIGNGVYVTLAKQDGTKHDDVAGPGNGYVDVFTLDGTFSRRLVSQGDLNSPWGLVQAPTGFGGFAGDLLVGNFGNGTIHAYRISSGIEVGTLMSSAGGPVDIPGLWGLIFGNGGSAGLTGTLYFSAGPGDESHGLFGSLTPQ